MSVGVFLVGCTGHLAANKLLPVLLNSTFATQKHVWVVGLGSRYSSEDLFKSHLRKQHRSLPLHRLNYVNVNWANMYNSIYESLHILLDPKKHVKKIIIYISIVRSDTHFLTQFLDAISSFVNKHKNIPLPLILCLEKPVGISLKGAKDVLNVISKHAGHHLLKTVFVDHFLQKNAVIQTLPKLAPYLNTHDILMEDIDTIYVNAVEQADLSGREIFWEYIGGIVADMIQSHLMLLTNEMLKHLDIDFWSFDITKYTLGKYNTYKGQSPTFAKIELRSPIYDFKIVLTAGKCMKKKETSAYIETTKNQVVKISWYPSGYIKLLSSKEPSLKLSVTTHSHSDSSYLNIFNAVSKNDFSKFAHSDNIVESWEKLLFINNSFDKDDVIKYVPYKHLFDIE